MFFKALARQTFSKRGMEKSGEVDIMIKIFAPISEYALKDLWEEYVITYSETDAYIIQPPNL